MSQQVNQQQDQRSDVPAGRLPVATEDARPAASSWESGGAKLWRAARRFVERESAMVADVDAEPSTRLRVLTWLYLLSAVGGVATTVWLLALATGVVESPTAMPEMGSVLRQHSSRFVGALVNNASVWFTWFALRNRRRSAALMAGVPLLFVLSQIAVAGSPTWRSIALPVIGLAWIASVWRELR
jgi:hypothetical protein